MGLFDKKDTPNFSDIKSGFGSAPAPISGKTADFSDVQSGSTSTASAGQTYVVKAGDSLSKIAKHFYGDGNKWKLIHSANSVKIPNPDLIHPGLELVIPGE